MIISKKINHYFFNFDALTREININKLLSARLKRKPKIGIIIDTSISIPPVTGVTYRLYYLSKKLAELGYKQVWFSTNRKFYKKSDIKKSINEDIAIYLFHPKKFYNPKFLQKYIRKEKIDILQYEDAQTFLHLGTELKKINNLPTVLEFHDVEATLFKTLKKSKKNVDLMNFLQFAGGQSADIVICMTPSDYKLLTKEIGISKEKLFLIPNGVDGKTFPCNKNFFKHKENIIIFLGNMFYPPNKQALILLCDKVLPLVKKEIPDIKLKAIGMVPELIKKRYKRRDDVIFTDEIKNSKLLNKELDSGNIGMATVFSGSGMKVKILNYCANGLPVITTPIGASGYENIKSLIIVKPNAQSIATAIISLLKNKQLSKKLGQKNRKSIIKEFEWKKIAKKMIKAYYLLYYADESNKGEIINIANVRPFWLEEGREAKKILSKSYKVNNKKIYELD